MQDNNILTEQQSNNNYEAIYDLVEADLNDVVKSNDNSTQFSISILKLNKYDYNGNSVTVGGKIRRYGVFDRNIIDLRNAKFTHTTSTLRLNHIGGNTHVIVPSGVKIVVNGNLGKFFQIVHYPTINNGGRKRRRRRSNNRQRVKGVIGNFDKKVPYPTIVLTGVVLAGSVDIEIDDNVNIHVLNY